ncbi:hypothetical protein BD309DRAFT_870600 [Dichomitus squalens]|nr:hypothetical protein BD309DRAFT_870600 [Dichomitus squalens]
MASPETPPAEEDDGAKQKCAGCRQILPLSDFPLKKKGSGAHEVRTRTCEDCTVRKKQWRDKGKVGHGNSGERDGSEANEEGAPSEDLDEVSLPLFLEFLKRQSEPYEIEARVSIPDIHGERHMRADSLAESVWETLNYRFIYHSSRTPKMSNGAETTYMYHCAQNSKRQRKPQKVPDASKHRDKEAMDGFPCQGWLSVTVTDGSDSLFITLGHRLDHIPYVPIDLPDSVVALVRDNPNMRPRQLWREVLKIIPKPTFSRKVVYAKWAQYDRIKWKRCDDEFESAKILLEEARSSPGPRSAELIPLPNEDGFRGIAFTIPEHLRQWGGRIREVALDSAWNTNGARFELYAVMGEVYGSGLPLGYLLLQSDGGEKGGKERYLTCFLSQIRDKWDLQAVFTHTDKDWSEINACPIKSRLSILRRMPAYYNVQEAHEEFSWISEDFVPLQQQANPVRV